MQQVFDEPARKKAHRDRQLGKKQRLHKPWLQEAKRVMSARGNIAMKAKSTKATANQRLGRQQAQRQPPTNPARPDCWAQQATRDSRVICSVSRIVTTAGVVSRKVSRPFNRGLSELLILKYLGLRSRIPSMLTRLASFSRQLDITSRG